MLCGHGAARRAFTLIEIVVVVAIIALLAGLLIPSLGRARHLSMSTTCLSQLRQFVVAAHGYTDTGKGRFPIAQYSAKVPDGDVWYQWDFKTIKDKKSRRYVTRPGLLWAGATNEAIQQCPGFSGGANTPGSSSAAGGLPTQRYTGYNYNTSYIGHGQGERIESPARVTDVRRPEQCALFGDGQYTGGANKFMRAPWDDVEHGGDDFDGRSAGTQGYRHLGKTNVAFCDGHAVSWRPRHTETEAGEQSLIAPGTGFLSPDNRMYDLR